MLSVVIPTKFERNNLEYCIKSIKRQTLKPKEILIVTTSHNTENINEIEQKYNVRVYIEERNGLSYSRNSGIMNTEGDIIAFIDDDAIAHKKWLYYLSKMHEIINVGICGGKIEPIWPKNVPNIIKNSTLAKEWLSLLDLAKIPIYVDRVIGCNFSLKREVFTTIGEFNTSIGNYSNLMYGGEETEFCERAGEKFKIVYCPKAIVYHEISVEKLKLNWFIKRSHDSGFLKAKMKRKPRIMTNNPRFNFFDYILLFPYLLGYIRARITKF